MIVRVKFLKARMIFFKSAQSQAAIYENRGKFPAAIHFDKDSFLKTVKSF